MTQLNVTNINQLQHLYELESANVIEWQSQQDRDAFLVEVGKYRSSDGTWKTDSFNHVAIPKPKSFKTATVTPDQLGKMVESAVFNLTEILSMLHETGAKLKKASKELRRASSDAQVASLKQEAVKIREAADAALNSAKFNGWFQIGSGIVGVGSTGRSMAKMRSTQQSTKYKSLDGKRKEIQQLQASTQRQINASSTGVKPTAKNQKKLAQIVKDQKTKLQEMKREMLQKKDGQAYKDSRKKVEAQKQKLELLKADQKSLDKQQRLQKKNTRLEKQLDKVESRIDGMINKDVEFSQRVNQTGTAISQMLQGVGSLNAARHDHEVGIAREEEKLQAAETTQHEAARQEAQEYVDNARELLQKAQQTLTDLQQQEASAVSKIWA